MEVSSGNGSWEKKVKTFPDFSHEGGEGSTESFLIETQRPFFFGVQIQCQAALLLFQAFEVGGLTDGRGAGLMFAKVKTS